MRTFNHRVAKLLKLYRTSERWLWRKLRGSLNDLMI